MAITDIQFSEELQTGAPSIKYRGNEGPQSPQEEQQMAGQDYSSSQYRMQLIEKLMAQGLDFGAASNEADRLIKLMLDRQRQGSAYGGIAGSDGRRRYGLGSIKDRLRKLIPNEAARVAEVAAPIAAMVAPQFALPAAIAAGLGKFDRTGSIGSGLKSGLTTYGLGTLSPGLPGVRDMGPQSGMFTTQPFGGKYNISNLFKKSAPISDLPTSGNTLGKSAPILEDIDMAYKAGDFDLAKAGSKVAKENLSLMENIQKEGLVKGVLKNIGEAKLSTKAMMGIVGVSGAAGLYTAMTQPQEELETLDRGVGLPGGISGIRTEVIEAMKDPSGEKLKALRVKYPFLGEQETKNIDIMAEGGRAGYYAGGQSIPSEYTMEDARKTAMQDRLGGITEVMKQADLYRQGDVGQMYMNQGGRIGAQEGGIMDLGGMEKDYRETGGFVDLGAEEKADDVPARLSVNEFVMTADAVRGAGGGDIDKGAEIMERVMKNLEEGGRISEESQGLTNRRQGASDMFEVSERLSAVV